MTRYSLRAYYDGKMRGLACCLNSVDNAHVISWIWEQVQSGLTVKCENTDTGATMVYDPDKISDPYEDDIVLP